ncbi:membrane protein insertion efficiency factor YidD [Sphingomonas sp. Sphisp140]|uniref:membrane protein insertion efficiency factor YidD n=1 Tax=unclassified Sphingomonas TaxID=196159 RepID=UPI0039AF9EDE
MIGKSVVRLVLWAADHDRVPGRLDRVAARWAISLIGLYRRHLSARSGRTCLFRKTCSSHALEAFERLGWREGVQEAAAQLRRCGGNYSMLRSVQGETMLITCDGHHFARADLSDAVVRSIS